MTRGIRIILRRSGLIPLELASWFTTPQNLEIAKRYRYDAQEEESGTVVLQVRGESTDWHDWKD